jgi:PAS domain S-box-containing protein
MLGWRREEVLGTPNPSVPPDLLDETIARRRLVVESGQPAPNYDAERLTRDGRRLPVIGTLSPLRNKRGRVVGLVGISKDASLLRRLQQQATMLAMLEERERIAMDLHDGAIQALFGLALNLGARARTLAEASPEASDALAQAMQQINFVAQELRAYLGSLRLGAPESRGLRAEIEALVVELQTSGMIRTRLELAPEVESLPTVEQRVHLAYLAREAISNIMRHANARTVDLALVCEGRRLVLRIRDDGRGFDPARTGRRRGDGLRNMAERARLLGGRLQVQSQRGQGTQITLELPLPNGRSM